MILLDNKHCLIRVCFRIPNRIQDILLLLLVAFDVTLLTRFPEALLLRSFYDWVRSGRINGCCCFIYLHPQFHMWKGWIKYVELNESYDDLEPMIAIQAVLEKG